MPTCLNTRDVRTFGIQTEYNSILESCQVLDRWNIFRVRSTRSNRSKFAQTHSNDQNMLLDV